MKKYAIIKDGIVSQIIEGKDDGSRNWEEYYSDVTKAVAKVAPENVGIGWKYEGDELINPNPVLSEQEQTDQWRATEVVDLYKLKIIIDNMGDLDTIETIISSQPKGVQLAWQNANTVRRDSKTVAGLAQVMGYSDTQLDTIFKNAKQVQL